MPRRAYTADGEPSIWVRRSKASTGSEPGFQVLEVPMRPNVRLAAGVLGVIVCASCGEDTTGPATPMVTVAGIVRNVDTTQPAPGIRVTLYGTNYADEVA